jgi:deoxyadenosine/deoxycytidine kinase
VTIHKENTYIGFEGPIAAGKTTLAGLFAEANGAGLVLEDFEHNEFLADFYANRDRWALAMQLWFLVSRHEQLVAHLPFSNGIAVADYTYAKNDVFAHVLLGGRELSLYQRISSALKLKSRIPDLIVYLDASDEVLLKRISARNRPFEALINSEYLEAVRAGYEQHLLKRKDIKILRYDTSRLHLDDDSELKNFYGQISLGLGIVANTV